MFGPLPTLHRTVLVLAALTVCAGIGLWVGAMPEIAVNLRAGLIAGTLVGLAAAFGLVHDFQHRMHEREARTARIRRRAH